MSAVYLRYSGFVGGEHFVFYSQCMKKDVRLSANAVPMDPPALEPNNLTMADSENYPSVTSLLTGITEGSSSGEGCAEDGKGFMSGFGHHQDSE